MGPLTTQRTLKLSSEGVKTYKSIPHIARFRVDPESDLATLTLVLFKGRRILAVFGVVL